MDRGPAREAFLEYRRSVRERHDAEDEQIMRGYRELARGRQLIRLSEAIVAGGTTTVEVREFSGRREVHVPALAVARADARYCWTNGIGTDGRCELRSKREVAPNNRRDRLTFAGVLPELDPGQRHTTWQFRVRAIVPIVPPPLRPRDSLRNYHVLFEAEWGIDPEPPVDPALLRHIGGDLYAVCAVWDLTEVERAVLALRSPE
jgi:hypothetical protein